MRSGFLFPWLSPSKVTLGQLCPWAEGHLLARWGLYGICPPLGLDSPSHCGQGWAGAGSAAAIVLSSTRFLVNRLSLNYPG